MVLSGAKARTHAGLGEADASQRPTQAIDELELSAHARARALCVTRLALLHLSGDRDEAVEWATWARRTTPGSDGIHSGRLELQLTTQHTILEPAPEEAEGEPVPAIDT